MEQPVKESPQESRFGFYFFIGVIVLAFIVITGYLVSTYLR